MISADRTGALAWGGNWIPVPCNCLNPGFPHFDLLLIPISAAGAAGMGEFPQSG